MALARHSETGDLFRELLSSLADRLLVTGHAAEALERHQTEDFDLLILEIDLSQEGDRELLSRLRERRPGGGAPFVVLDAHPNDSRHAECYALGADLCFARPVDPRALSAAVTTQLRRAEEMLHSSRRDPLTQLPNRTAFREAFVRASALSDRTGLPLSLALVDLDRFKLVNDRYGHAVGDEVLCHAALVFDHSLRRSDLVARWGGEEFAVLMPNSDPEAAATAMRKMLERLRDTSYPAPEDAYIRLSFSAGVARVKPGEPLDQAIERADRRLYRAKGCGRGRVHSGREPGHG